jgi:Rrf2 family protein
MAVLAATPDTAQTSVEIATRLGKHPAFLRRITGQLVKAGLLRTYQKPGGGYLLAGAPDTITLGDIYIAVVHRPNVSMRRASMITLETGAIDWVLEAIVRSASRRQVSALGTIKLSAIL